jgi:catechol 2,3-dioxygenase-like lactoylglutathione lyase family enzyme
MKSPRLGSAIPILDVRHIEEALSFYVDRLGFAVDFRYENDPTNYAGVRRDDVRLHMHRQPSEHFENGTWGRLKFRIPVDDPDALFAEFWAMGVLDDDVEVLDTEWKTREFGFRDPDGNALVFFKIL